MSRRGVTAWRRCSYCGCRTFRELACENCGDLLELDPNACGGIEPCAALELDQALQDLASRAAARHDRRLWASSSDERRG